MLYRIHSECCHQKIVETTFYSWLFMKNRLDHLNDEAKTISVNKKCVRGENMKLKGKTPPALAAKAQKMHY